MRLRGHDQNGRRLGVTADATLVLACLAARGRNRCTPAAQHPIKLA